MRFSHVRLHTHTHMLFRKPHPWDMRNMLTYFNRGDGGKSLLMRSGIGLDHAYVGQSRDEMFAGLDVFHEIQQYGTFSFSFRVPHNAGNAIRTSDGYSHWLDVVHASVYKRRARQPV